MKIMKKLILLFLITISLRSFSQTTQDSTSKVVVITYSGKEIIGKVLSDDGRELLLNTDKAGKVFIRKDDVKSIELIKKGDVINNEYVSAGPFTTRYQITNNALPIKKGENYAMWNLYGPEVHFAVTSRLNVGVMATWIASPIALALKYTLSNKEEGKIHYSIGTLLGSSGYLYNGSKFGGLHWLSATFGNRKNNFTVSGGYGYFNSTIEIQKPGIYKNFMDIPFERSEGLTGGPLCSISGIVKIGKKASFVFDNMFIFSKNTYSDMYVTYTTKFDKNGWPIYEYEYTITNKEYLDYYVLVMPGIRFQKSDDKAFQVTISNVRYERNGKMVTFPLPMCSWFRKF
jgi:hypothetical protein